MKKQITAAIFFLLCAANAFSQLRALNDIFPGLSQEIRSGIFSEDGYVRTSQRRGGFAILGNERGAALDPSIINMVLQTNPGYFVESIAVVPGSPGSVNLLGIYNALGNIRDLRGRLYDSHSQGQAAPLFTEATRIVSERQTSSIPDPAPAAAVPQRETVYIRLRDTNFGNTFYRGEISLLQNGLRYTMSNFRNMTYLFVPVIREGRFIAQLYIEPIQEGVLIYSIAGADVSDFFASRIHVESAISKRLAVIKSWAADGIRRNSL